MRIHLSDQEITLVGRDREALKVQGTHVEAAGEHTLILTTNAEKMPQLRKKREEIVKWMQTTYGIVSTSQLIYLERQPDGKLFQVDLHHLGSGPGRHGEPEHWKSQGRWVSRAEAAERLGRAALPSTSSNEGPTLEETKLTPVDKSRLRHQFRPRPKL